VSGRNGISYKHRVALDRYYARRWSIWLDLGIILKTVTTVFSFHQTS
jgi:exopolysaccharide production protein ExoY